MRTFIIEYDPATDVLSGYARSETFDLQNASKSATISVGEEGSIPPNMPISAAITMPCSDDKAYNTLKYKICFSAGLLSAAVSFAGIYYLYKNNYLLPAIGLVTLGIMGCKQPRITCKCLSFLTQNILGFSKKTLEFSKKTVKLAASCTPVLIKACNATGIIFREVGRLTECFGNATSWLGKTTKEFSENHPIITGAVISMLVPTAYIFHKYMLSFSS